LNLKQVSHGRCFVSLFLEGVNIVFEVGVGIGLKVGEEDGVMVMLKGIGEGERI
jgi:hypothetical protein